MRCGALRWALQPGDMMGIASVVLSMTLKRPVAAACRWLWLGLSPSLPKKAASWEAVAEGNMAMASTRL